MLRVTVLLPVFNAQEYIAEAVTSVLSQTYNDYELIIINDGSIDGSLDAIDKLIDGDSRVKVLNKKQSGIIDSLNIGIEVSDSQYIARMDADDICSPVRFQVQADILRGNPRVIVTGSNIEKFGALSSISNFPINNRACKNTLLFYSCFAHPSVMLKRTVIDENNIRYRHGYEYAEDYKLWSELAKFGEFHNSEKALLRYRVHAGQTGSLKKLKQRESHVAIAHENLAGAGVEVPIDVLMSLMWPKDAPDKLSAFYGFINTYFNVVKKDVSSVEVNKIFLKQFVKFFYCPNEYV